MSSRSIEEILRLLNVPDARWIRVGPLSSDGTVGTRAGAVKQTQSRVGQWWATAPTAAIALSAEEADALIAFGAREVSSISAHDSPTEV